MKLEFCLTDLRNIVYIKIQQNPSCGWPGGCVWTDRQTDGQTDVTKLILDFFNFGNAIIIFLKRSTILCFRLDLSGSLRGSVVGCCGYVDELLCSIKFGEYLDYVSDF